MRSVTCCVLAAPTLKLGQPKHLETVIGSVHLFCDSVLFHSVYVLKIHSTPTSKRSSPKEYAYVIEIRVDIQQLYITFNVLAKYHVLTS